jgi:phosphoglycolate phosphatase
MIRLVLFDIDGTLIASGGAGLRAFASVARTVFRAPDIVSRLHFSGRTDTSIVREFFSLAGIPPIQENFDRFFDDYVFWLDHYLHETSGAVLPGVHEFIAAMSELPMPPVMALLTGNIRLGAEIKLRHYGLWSHFKLGAFGDDHEDRDELARIARNRGEKWLGKRLRGEEILVIGDTPLDVRCARCIGAQCLAVATGGTPLNELRNHRPARAVSSLLDLHPAEVCLP